jgi:Kef-type K+ transport system membrane component KefB/Trk K+ transport system NAD-binding subunit
MFDELVILLLAAAVAGIIAMRLRQPLIIAYIIVGILAGPVGFDVIRSTEQLRVLAEMGLALLLFVVGLKLDPKLIRNMGTVALATGLGQMVFTGIIGFVLTLGMGMPVMTAIYVAVAIVFSSTILIVKLLSDKRETDSLYGRIALGFLIVEDIVVVLAMIGLSSFTAASSLHPIVRILMIILKGAGLFVGVWVVSKFLLPRFLRVVARSTELLVIFGITWALLLAAITELMGFNKEVGAFVAGLSLASTMYRDLLSTKLVSLRDFLLLFFFLELGSRLDLHGIYSQIYAAVPLSMLVLLGKPFIVMVIMGRMGYRNRTGFLAGMTVAQISEFSLILIAMAVSAGHIGNDILSLVTLILMITMGIDVHLILHSQTIYERLAPYLRIFERNGQHREDNNKTSLPEMPHDGVILVGLGRYGSNIGNELINRGRMTLGVDFDPEAVRMWKARGEQAVFGDAEDPDFAHALPLSSARWVISSIRDNRLNSGIIRTLRHAGYRGHFACAVEEPVDGSDDRLQEYTDIIFNPFKDSAVQAADLVFATEDQIARNAMDKLIESMSDHYIICGYGRMGQQIVKELRRHGVPHVVVEMNPEQIPKLKELNVPFVEGKASEDVALIKAGIERAKGLVAVATTDEENVFIVLTARVLNQDLFIVARSILEENEDKLRRAGADRVMSPYILGGRRMAAAILKPRVMDFLDLAMHNDGIDTEIDDIVVSPSAPFVGKMIKDSDIRITTGVLILAVKRPDGTAYANPASDLVINSGDEIIIMGTSEQLRAVEKLASGQ